MEGAIQLAGSDPAVFGQEVGFDVEVSGRRAPGSRLYITLVCLQGDRVVYQLSDPVVGTAVDFLLRDQDGDGLQWDGGAATAVAVLVYRTEKGHNVTITNLDSVTFPVEPAA